MGAPPSPEAAAGQATGRRPRSPPPPSPPGGGPGGLREGCLRPPHPPAAASRRDGGGGRTSAAAEEEELSESESESLRSESLSSSRREVPGLGANRSMAGARRRCLRSLLWLLSRSVSEERAGMHGVGGASGDVLALGPGSSPDLSPPARPSRPLLSPSRNTSSGLSFDLRLRSWSRLLCTARRHLLGRQARPRLLLQQAGRQAGRQADQGGPLPPRRRGEGVLHPRVARHPPARWAPRGPR